MVRDAASRLLDWHDDAMATVVRDCSDVVDPLYTVLAEGGPLHARHDVTGAPLDRAAYAQRLEDTGRPEAAAAFRARGTG